MRNGWTSWLSAALVLLCCAAPARAAQQATRVFAMQPKLDLAWMDSREHFHDKLFGLADAGLRAPGTPLIQDGADDVASHLRPDGRNLVVWPEDMGLWAALTGTRGAGARASGSLVGAVATLFTSYAPQMDSYGGAYPAVAARVPRIRLLELALTDMFGRTAVETFSEMAARYHVWLAAGVDMAQSWHVVCNTDEHPPQEPCDEQNTAKVQKLGDPDEPGRGYAYEATSPDVSNMALLFGPDGKLVSKQVKAYVTPIEVGQAEGQLAALDLVPGSIASGPSAVRTPIGTLGFVTSKDAWMPDVVDRLEEAGVDLLIQPEFFAGDLATTSGMWAADTLKAAGYSDLLRHPGFSAMVLPSAVGNVFDFSADEQSHIAERLAKPGAGKWLIGQPPAPGLTGVTPWVVPDPLTPRESIAQRRNRLGEVGKKLAPGSGASCPDPAKPGACENGHVETALWKDVKVGFPGRQAPEQHAAVAIAGRFAVVAYEQRRGLADRVIVSTSSDGARHWAPGREALPKAPGTQQWPAVTVDRRGRVTLAWAKKLRIYFAPGRIGGRNRATFGSERPLDKAAPAGVPQWRPALARGRDGVVHAVFVDARAKSADGRLPQAGIYYTRIRSARAEKARRLDSGKPAKLAAKLDNAWSPAIAVHGRDVLVTWTDFMHYDWDVRSRVSRNGGATFGNQVDSNREKAGVEDLSDSPQPVFTNHGPFIAWTDFHKRDSVNKVHPLYDTYLAPPGKPPVQVDPYGGKQVSTFWPSACADGRDVIVAFQDSATGVARVRITRMRGGIHRGRARLLSKTQSPAYRPAIACDGGRFIVAWEDMRTGAPRIRTATGKLTQIQ